MKFSTISLLVSAAVLSSSEQLCFVSGNFNAIQWATRISTAQSCLRTCGEADGTNNTNLLVNCLSNGIGAQLEICCKVQGDCVGALVAAKQVLETNLADIKVKASNYLTCIYNNNGANNCNAGVCVNLLTGGAKQDEFNDFDVGVNRNVTAQNSLYQMTRNARTCDDMNPFGKRACETAVCCTPCQSSMAEVVGAVTNDLLLVAYSNTVSNCPEKTCEAYMNTTSTRRKIAENAEEQTTKTTTSVAKNGEHSVNAATELADECANALQQDIVQYNETYGAETFLECLYKKMGKIAVEAMDNDKPSSSSMSAESSSSSSASSFATSATVVAVVASASVIVAMVV